MYRLKTRIIQIVILAELLRKECPTHLIWTVIQNSLRVDEVVAVGCPLVNFALDNHSCDELISWHSKPNGYHQRIYAPCLPSAVQLLSRQHTNEPCDLHSACLRYPTPLNSSGRLSMKQKKTKKIFVPEWIACDHWNDCRHGWSRILKVSGQLMAGLHLLHRIGQPGLMVIYLDRDFYNRNSRQMS